MKKWLALDHPFQGCSGMATGNELGLPENKTISDTVQ